MNKSSNIRRLGQAGFLWAMALLCAATSAVAQSDSDTTGTGKAEASIELKYTEANNKTKILEAAVKTKTGGSWKGVEGVEVHFYRSEAVPEKLLGNAASNKKGIATLILPEGEEKYASPAHEYTYVAAIENSDRAEDSQEEITVAESDFEMTLEEEDSVKQVHISLTETGPDGGKIPVKDVEVSLFVKRLFGLLPISDDPETTDENGEAVADFPTDLPGDTAGNLIIVAKVEDNDRFGNLEFSRKINWGKPLVIDPERDKRQLWSSRANAPLYLIVIVNSMLIGIWGVIFYILFQAYKISRLGRNKASA